MKTIQNQPTVPLGSVSRVEYTQVHTWCCYSLNRSAHAPVLESWDSIVGQDMAAMMDFQKHLKNVALLDSYC